MDSGEFEISIGASAADIRLSARVTLESTHQAPVVIDRMTPFSAALVIQRRGRNCNRSWTRWRSNSAAARQAK